MCWAGYGALTVGLTCYCGLLSLVIRDLNTRRLADGTLCCYAGCKPCASRRMHLCMPQLVPQRVRLLERLKAGAATRAAGCMTDQVSPQKRYYQKSSKMALPGLLSAIGALNAL